MPWYIFAFTASILAAAAAIVEKRALQREHAMEFGAVLSVFSLLVTVPFLGTIDYSKLTLAPLLIVFGATLGGSLAFLLISKSVRHLEVSAVSPLLVLGAGITATIGAVVLGEKLTQLQIFGLVLLVLGVYILETHPHSDWLEPFKTVVKSKYVTFIILALLIYGFTATLDRVVLARFGMQPEAYIVIAHLFLMINFVVMLSIFHGGFSDLVHGIKNAGWIILLVAVLTVAYRYAHTQAIALAYIGLVEAIKRTSAFFATLIGGELFHEKNLFRKVVACLIMIGGSVLLII
ncbi:MAG: EamA family transporter [Candidatus Kerfeldbacteria bacterium]|nr:EamA family transporter [Candidatus Kerfeldbacteria bacterium]